MNIIDRLKKLRDNCIELSEEFGDVHSNFLDKKEPEEIAINYYFEYRDLLPSYQEEYDSFRKWSLRNGNSCYLEDLENDFTFLKRIDEDLYEDIHTGYKIMSNISGDIDKCAEAPFAIMGSPISNHKDDPISHNSYDSLEDIVETPSVYMDIAAENIYKKMLKSDSISDSQRKIIQEKLTEIDNKRIGEKYAISYQYLFPALNINSDYYLFRSNYSLRGKNTIIEYLGNGLYCDLNTDMIYHDHRCSIPFINDGDANSLTIDDKEFNFILENPFRIDSNNRKKINDNSLVKIWNETYLQKDELIECLNKQKIELGKKYRALAVKSLEEEKKLLRQKRRAELEEKIAAKKRKKSIADAKKVYRLK